MEALRVGYRIPFDRPPPLSECPISLPAYSPHSIRGVALNQELQNLLRKGAVEPAPQSPGFYSRLFLVKKASGSWRPIIDLSTLNHYVTSSRFHMDSSVSPELHSPRRLDDLPGPARRISSGSSSSRFASFSSLRGRREALPIQGPLLRSYDRASSLHEDYGTSVRHPPQAWGQDASLPGRLAHPGLFRNRLSSVEGQAPSSLYRTWHPGQSHEVVSSSLSVHSVLGHGDSISALHCSPHTSTSQQPHPTDRGVPLNPVSSSVPLASPSRPPVFPDSSRLQRDDQDEASPTLPQGPVGLSGRPVPGLLVSSLSRGSSLVVEAGSAEGGREPLPSSSGHQLLLGRFRRGLGSPSRRAPRLGSLAPPSESSLYQHEGAAGSSARPSGLRNLIVGMSVALFCDNTTTVAYLRRSGGTFSSTLNSTAREVLLWAESRRIRLLPQFIMGSSNVTADALSRPNQVIGSEWTLHQEVVDQLVHRWPAMIDLFATSLTARLPVYFSPASDPRAAGTDALLQPWDDLQAYAFPPIAIIRRILLKLRSSKNCELTLIAPFWPQRDWFPDLLELLSDVPITLSDRRDLLRQPHFHRFHQNLPMLRLTAWRLSSGSPSKPVSLLRWLDNLSSAEDCPPA